MNRLIKTLTLVSLLLSGTSCVYERSYDEPSGIIYVKSSQIWTSNGDGSEQKQLTFSGSNGHPSWSADRKKILYHSDIDGNYEIFMMNSDGSGKRQLTFTSSDISMRPTWMRNGNIIYSLNQSGTYTFEIITTDGNFVRSIPAPNGPMEIALSPSGLYLADSDGPGTITMINLSDGSQTVLSVVGSRRWPHWDTNGGRVFYKQNGDIRFTYINNPGVENSFYTAPNNISAFAIEPSDKYIYYSLYNSSPDDGIYRLDTETFTVEAIILETGISQIGIEGKPQ